VRALAILGVVLTASGLGESAWAQEGDAAKPADAASPAPAPTAPPASAATPAPASEHDSQALILAPSFSWEPFGYLRMQYIAVQDDPTVQYVGRNDGFELQNARIGARGHLGSRASFVLSFDGAIDERVQLNVPQGRLGFGMRDAFLDVGLSGKLVVRGGYWQTWVDPQAQIPDTEREFVDLPIETRGVRPNQGYQTPGLPPGRSIGVALRLDPPVYYNDVALGFELAAQNGSDEFSSNNDNNLPALSAAAILRLPHRSFLVVAGRWNPRTVGELPFRQDETDLQGSVGLHVVAGPLSLGGAAIVQHTTYDSTNGPAQNAYGAHAQAMLEVPAQLVPDRLPLAIGYRFGVLDPSSLITTDRVMEHTVGAVLGVPSLYMRLQLQLTHVVEQTGRELDNDRVQLAAEVVLR
jgi:hypothetical protein